MFKLFEKINSNSPVFKYLAISLATVLVIAVFFIGFYFGHRSEKASIAISQASINGKILNFPETKPDYLGKDVNFKLFNDVVDIVKNYYYKKDIGDSQMFYGALEGIVASLGDPYSVFLPPDISKKFTQELSGKFEGIGAEIGLRKNHLTLIAPLPESPAEKAGLKAGDWIIAINNLDTSSMTVDQAVNLIRGKKGTSVKLTINRGDEQQAKEYVVQRDTIKIVSASWENKDGYAIIKITHFNEDTWERFEKIINEIIAAKPKGIVLDLRNNPGGFLDSAIDVSGTWIDGQPVVVEKFSEQNQQVYKSNVEAKLAKFKTVILVNGGSASGSEIVAGALQDYKVAKLVGEKTFGKGSVQDMHSLSDGSTIKITIAKWLTPLGRAIDEVGIEPDFNVKLTDEDYNSGRDPQLDKALELLK